jgi:hypothetical protein
MRVLTEVMGAWLGLALSFTLACHTQAAVDAATVQVHSGQIVGATVGDISTFKGIPYARPVGSTGGAQSMERTSPVDCVRASLHSASSS